MQSRVPGARQQLQPKIDVLGNPIMRTGNALETMLDPTRPTNIKSNKLIDELRRLFDAGFSATPTRFADEKKFTTVLTPEQITELQERAGQTLEAKLTALIDTTAYKKLDDDGKMRIMRNFTNRSRVDAHAVMVEILVANLTGDEQKAKLSELKASGFMTKQVFDKWQELFSPTI